MKSLVASFNCQEKTIQYAIEHQNKEHSVDYKFSVVVFPNGVCSVLGNAQEVMYLIGYMAAMGENSLIHVL